jgi:hypothetical protein
LNRIKAYVESPTDVARPRPRLRRGHSAERLNSNLDENHGVRMVRVLTGSNVVRHLVFGVVAISSSAFSRFL